MYRRYNSVNIGWVDSLVNIGPVIVQRDFLKEFPKKIYLLSIQ